MPYQLFLQRNTTTAVDPTFMASHEKDALPMLKNFKAAEALLHQLGGTTFDKGLFRTHSIGSSYYWTAQLRTYFDRDDFYCFAYDWVGRQYAVSEDNTAVLMFDPATLEDFELELSLQDFLNETLTEDREGNLLADDFEAANALVNDGLQPGECIGYAKPLFLNGEDDPGNYERTDLSVYWETNVQIYNKIKSLPEGTKISDIHWRED